MAYNTVTSRSPWPILLRGHHMYPKKGSQFFSRAVLVPHASAPLHTCSLGLEVSSPLIVHSYITWLDLTYFSKCILCVPLFQEAFPESSLQPELNVSPLWHSHLCIPSIWCGEGKPYVPAQTLSSFRGGAVSLLVWRPPQSWAEPGSGSGCSGL